MYIYIYVYICIYIYILYILYLFHIIYPEIPSKFRGFSPPFLPSKVLQIRQARGIGALTQTDAAQGEASGGVPKKVMGVASVITQVDHLSKAMVTWDPSFCQKAPYLNRIGSLT